MSTSWKTARIRRSSGSPASPGFTAPPDALRKLGYATFAWVVVFAAFHVYWGFGGQFGFGDASNTVPDVRTAADWAYTVVIGIMFVVGALIPFATFQPWGRKVPTWMILTCSWTGFALLAIRGFSGLLDSGLRESGLMKNGLTGLTYEQVLGDAHPTAYTLWSSSGVDLYFFIGGVLFGLTAIGHRRAVRNAR
ncbi:DUF3995 domain-containing protein [Streptomyces sp. H39-S7]|uniref:DUF3995 domain-containing protein n=1 Tax=Streptomyces sp. H39-S7 TaxID=3004357 RepID=UPI0022B07E4E|nr:DUF3995 domain-containing protein [Streptomyces sp. H39-S7]MCZ4125423.1 DUF3995 domain-containing protein [Streptomyces sp. H39-S7]